MFELNEIPHSSQLKPIGKTAPPTAEQTEKGC